jgi:hypothetical protein
LVVVVAAMRCHNIFSAKYWGTFVEKNCPLNAEIRTTERPLYQRMKYLAQLQETRAYIKNRFSRLFFQTYEYTKLWKNVSSSGVGGQSQSYK